MRGGGGCSGSLRILIREFFSDVRGELKKVSFPTRAETVGSTTVVIVFCIIMSLYLSFVDSILVWLVEQDSVSRVSGSESRRMAHSQPMIRG